MRNLFIFAALAAALLGGRAAPAAAPDIDAALRAISAYTVEQSRAPLAAVTELVGIAAGDPAFRAQLAAKLAALLASGATVDAKKFACQQLSLVGSDAEVPALAKLLGDKELSLAARAALVRIPGQSSLGALLAAASAAGGQELIGLINALGERRAAPAVPLIAKQLAAEDMELVAAALDALGKIGGRDALAALKGSSTTLRLRLQPVRADALLKCADALAAAGDAAGAAAIYQELVAPEQAPPVRLAAFLASLSIEKKDARQLIEKALADDDPALARAALRFVQTQGDAALVRALAASAVPVVARMAFPLLLKLERPRNLALGATATSPDDIEKDGAAGGDQAAIDGDPATYWDEADGQKLYRLVVTFKEPANVSAISIQAWDHHSFSPKDFDILCDGAVVKEVRGAVYEGNEFLCAFSRTRCSSLELKITGYYPQSPAIRELEIYDVAELPRQQKTGFRWEQKERSLALLAGDAAVWRFVATVDTGKPCFDPVALADGTALTAFRPPDHPWHRALWFSWTSLNGLNYWEENPASGASPGTTKVERFEAAAAGPNAARMELAIAYHPPGKPPVLTEKRVIEATAPDAAGRYTIDWAATFTAAGEDVLLKGGIHGGGYAGLSARIAQNSDAWRVIDSEGRVDLAANAQKARWLDFSLRDKTTGTVGGMTVFDHPGNLRHPSIWYVIMDTQAPFGYFSPAPLFAETYALSVGKSFTLRYRILVHPGRADAAAIEAAWKEWAQ